MTKKKKSPKQQPTEIQMANNDIMVITGIKMKYLSLKENEYGHNHFFNVLDIAPLQKLIELRKSLKMPIWDYNDKFYLKINDIKIKELPNEHTFQKMCLILWISLLENMISRKKVSKLLVIVFLKLIKYINLLYIEKWDCQNQA